MAVNFDVLAVIARRLVNSARSAKRSIHSIGGIPLQVIENVAVICQPLT
jgi:hypothetical protein